MRHFALTAACLLPIALCACVKPGAADAPSAGIAPATARDVCVLVADGARIGADLATLRLKKPAIGAEAANLASRIEALCAAPPTSVKAAEKALLQLGERYLLDRLTSAVP